MFPKLDVDNLCKPVSVAASQAVWKAGGPVGSNKNRTFRPRFHPCAECTQAPAFPREFTSITPAQKGSLFDDWTPPPTAPYPLGF